jgi:hypothetical protein
MAKDDFETLLARMPDIASAVNAFQSEALQREAFQSLVATFGGASGEPSGKTADPPTAPKAQSEKAGADTSTNKPARRKAPYSPKLVKDLDLAPVGKKSFKAFIDEKQPKSNEDKYAVSVYWLEQELALTPVTIDHVASIFRLTQGWKEPTNIRSGITMAASRKGTIDTKDFFDLKTTPQGRNFVEHELPPKKGK